MISTRDSIPQGDLASQERNRREDLHANRFAERLGVLLGEYLAENPTKPDLPVRKSATRKMEKRKTGLVQIESPRGTLR